MKISIVVLLFVYIKIFLQVPVIDAMEEEDIIDTGTNLKKREIFLKTLENDESDPEILIEIDEIGSLENNQDEINEIVHMSSENNQKENDVKIASKNNDTNEENCIKKLYDTNENYGPFEQNFQKDEIKTENCESDIVFQKRYSTMTIDGSLKNVKYSKEKIPYKSSETFPKVLIKNIYGEINLDATDHCLPKMISEVDIENSRINFLRFSEDIMIGHLTFNVDHISVIQWENVDLPKVKILMIKASNDMNYDTDKNVILKGIEKIRNVTDVKNWLVLSKLRLPKELNLYQFENLESLYIESCICVGDDSKLLLPRNINEVYVSITHSGTECINFPEETSVAKLTFLIEHDDVIQWENFHLPKANKLIISGAKSENGELKNIENATNVDHVETLVLNKCFIPELDLRKFRNLKHLKLQSCQFKTQHSKIMIPNETKISINQFKSNTEIVKKDIDKTATYETHIYCNILTDLTSTKVNAKYQVERLIFKKGEGQEHDIYKAMDTKKNIVVIKKIGNDRRDFYRDEEKIHAELANYESVIKFIEVIEDEKFSYFVMEYASGGDLFEYMKRRKKRLDETTAIKFIKQIAEIVSVMHNKGIIHRDLKPENIVLTETDNPILKLIDFDGACYVNECSQKEIFGTFNYLAPQPSKTWDFKKADVYSMGMILYVLVTDADPEHDFKKINETSEPIKNLIRKMTDKNQETRISVAEVLNALENIENQEKFETVTRQFEQQQQREAQRLEHKQSKKHPWEGEQQNETYTNYRKNILSKDRQKKY